MPNELEKILNDIQFKTGKTLEEIAKEIGYSRPHLNNAKNKKGSEKIVGILKTKYYNILQGGSTGNGRKDDPAPGYIPAEKVIQMLEEQNAFLRRNFEASLMGLGIQAASILAHVATGLEKDDEREAQGDSAKLQRLKNDTGRRIAEKLQPVLPKGKMNTAGK